MTAMFVAAKLPFGLGRASLQHGWLPVAIQVTAGLLFLVAVGWRSGRRRRLLLPFTGALGAAVGVSAWWYAQFEGLSGDSPPNIVWVWIGLTGTGLGVAILGFPGADWWRRVASAVSVLFCALSAGVVLNGWVGYWPTAQIAWNVLSGVPLPHEIDAAQMRLLQRDGIMPTHGTIVRIDTGSAASHFSHRPEFVYLPPAWYAASPPPKLPAVMMLGGEYETPADWLRGGDVYPTIDSFALAHHGVSPIFVFGDATGWFRNDTECVNGIRGNAADHLTEDVVPAVIRQFGASDRGANWGVVGWSMGGTCSVDLTVMHPDKFTSFVDIQGDRMPNAGTRDQTINRLFGGNAAAYESFNPAAVMREHGPYVGVSGWFSPPLGPGSDAASRQAIEVKREAARTLCDTAKRVAISCVLVPLGLHTMQSGTRAFDDALPWLAGRLDTPNVEKMPLP